MQKIILSLILYVFSLGCFSQVKVKGYVKKDGTYVSPHVRSNPDGYKYNNYSSYGNVEKLELKVVLEAHIITEHTTISRTAHHLRTAQVGIRVIQILTKQIIV